MMKSPRSYDVEYLHLAGRRYNLKLIACHIDNFGKLSNININFNDGVNIINKPNGWGKSTLAAFLKAMLYGFDTKKETGALDKERKIYTPWQGGTYGGTLDFEVGGAGYRVMRTFGNTEKSDEFHLYRLNTMIECNDFSPMLGEELFELDRNSFKRSVFIGQLDCAAMPTGAINAKLGNLAENTNDINNYETAAADIKASMNKLSPNRLTGTIKSRRNAITALEQELKGYQAAEESISQISGKIKQKTDQKKELSGIREDYGKALNTASQDSRRQAQKNNYEAICADESEKKKQLEDALLRLGGEVPDMKELSECGEWINELNSVQAVEKNLDFSDDKKDKLQELSNVFADKSLDDASLDTMQKKIANISSVKNEYDKMELKLSQMTSLAMLTDGENEPLSPTKTKLVPGGIAAIVFGLIITGGAAFFSLNEKYSVMEIALLCVSGFGLLLTLCGVIMMIVGIKKNGRNQREYIRKLAEFEEEQKAKQIPIKELKSKLEEIKDGIDSMEKEVDAFFKSFLIEASSDTYQEKLFELKTMLSDFNRLSDVCYRKEQAAKQISDLKDKTTAYLGKYGYKNDDYDVALSELKNLKSEYEFAQKNYETSKNKKASFESENDIKEILSPAECPYTLDELNDLIKKIDASVDEVNASLAQYNRQLDDLQEQLDVRDEKEQEYRNMLSLQEEEQHKYHILELTADMLANAKEQFTARYMAPISNGFQKYFGILTQNTDRNWQVDANINLMMIEEGQLRDVRSMSAGYQDLIGICMRFALVDAMYPDEKPFLILDDPFVNLDNEKLARGKELLIELEHDYQVIYFTCHGSREYK